ncbi:P-loop containing nucleoside triphosphate hydrolase protein [Apiospora arundinis]|uniref:RNA helicase n=1 Tax=Apiospora arundinis TaxID=335852 RepID=A0ABR2JAV6_9PEZI
MQSIASARICPLCMFTSLTRPAQTLGRSWLAPRYYGAVSGGGGRNNRRSSSPSRMVLSDDPSRSPSSRLGRGRDSEKPRRKIDGPWAAMNQTTFRGSREGALPSSASRSSTGGGGKKQDRRTKAMKMQSSLASVSYGHRTRMKEDISGVESFDQLDLLPAVKTAITDEVLKGMVDIKPTPVQRLAIPALIGQDIGRSKRRNKTGGREEFLLAAETGSGKTLAYLVPIVNALKEAEAADPAIQKYRAYFDKQKAAMQEPDYTGPREYDPHPTAARPRVIVLVPTAELVDQVGVVAKKLSHSVKFKTDLFSANVAARVIQRNMYSPGGIDLIVSTPHLLSSMADSDPNILSRVTHLVIDEADSLLDRSFSPVTTSILDRALPSMKQLILCSATIPKRLDNYMATQFPDMIRITTPNLHAIPRRVQLGVVDVTKDPYRNNKNLACADAIWSIGKDAARHEGAVAGEMDVKRIMVFVNEREKTQEVADFLISKGIDAVALHRDTSEHRQSEMLDSFTTKDPLKTDAKPETPATSGRRSLPNTKVMVATDLASRGIDTLAVRHVILYDVPHTTIDFIHRLGRAGRMGRRGRGVVLVGKDDRRDIVAEVRESMYMGQALI